MKVRVVTLLSAIAALTIGDVFGAKCPFGYDAQAGAPGQDRTISSELYSSKNCEVVNYDAVKKDLLFLMTDSKDFWPADSGHYGGLMIRLSWHCNGSYRSSDGRGGCDGARIRYNPERSWEDNTNLDKALTLLEPIKEKYGSSLSWGDLIVLAGNVAIESMGGPVLGFCGGRRDDVDGTNSIQLGPSPEQEAVAPCAVDGDCKAPLGPTTLGLIYVNPEGPMGNPDPTGSVPQIRDTFARMGMDDRETVALIGGGHAFGKMHGACTTGPGTCGTGPLKGRGNNTFTSGFEGSWTFTPTKWGNGYFRGLTTLSWELFIGPGGHNQWRPTNETNPPVRMLTADIALLKDPSYLAISKEFAADLPSLNDAFSRAWYKLTSHDMGPVARCRGNNIPPAQPFQNPLPPSPSKLPNYNSVRTAIKGLLNTNQAGLTGDKVGYGKTYNGALFVNAAWQCASTFRLTDYAGGCNGAKIRFSPMKDWPANAGVDKVIAALAPVKKSFPNLSTADLIVLAGEVALEEAGAGDIAFTGGRVDAVDGSGVEHLAPRTYYPSAAVAVLDSIKVSGLSKEDTVALAGRPRSPAQQKLLGFKGSYTTDPSKVSNLYFKLLLNEKWTKVSDKEYKADGKDIYMLDTDLALVQDPTLKSVVSVYAANELVFKKAFAAAWSKLMTADHFKVDSY